MVAWRESAADMRRVRMDGCSVLCSENKLKVLDFVEKTRLIRKLSSQKGTLLRSVFCFFVQKNFEKFFSVSHRVSHIV